MDSPMPAEKVVVLLKATGDAPILKQSKFKVLKSESFVFISEFLRKNLKLDTVVRVAASLPPSPYAFADPRIPLIVRSSCT